MSAGPNFPAEEREIDGGGGIVYVVDDDPSMLGALQTLFRSVGYEVHGFGVPRDFLAFPRPEVPSCLVLDVRLRGESGLAFFDAAAKSDLRIPVLFMTGYGDIAMSVRAMKAGAVHFFAKPFHEQEMLDAVADALSRDAERIAAERAVVALRASYTSLTPREKEVLPFIIGGFLNKQIAAELNLSEVTVKIHRGQIMRKMEVRSVADLVRKADALGIEPAHRDR
jgi:FixJ family two-component response regulator